MDINETLRNSIKEICRYPEIRNFYEETLFAIKPKDLEIIKSMNLLEEVIVAEVLNTFEERGEYSLFHGICNIEQEVFPIKYRLVQDPKGLGLIKEERRIISFVELIAAKDISAKEIYSWLRDD
jgi:hypothetical protein